MRRRALDLLLALHTGVPGAATIHATAADDPFSRLATLPLLAGPNIAAAFVQPAITTGVHLVVHCRRASGRERFVEEIVERGRIAGRWAPVRAVAVAVAGRGSGWAWGADGRSARLLQESGYAHASTSRPMPIGGIRSAVSASLAWLLTGLGAVALVAAVAAGVAPFSWLGTRTRRLRRSRRALWSDVCDLLISSARAGLFRMPCLPWTRADPRH